MKNHHQESVLHNFPSETQAPLAAGTPQPAPRSRRGLLLALCGFTLLGACSWLHIGDSEVYDYRKTQVRQQPLEVPPDLSQLPKDERYAVPSATAAAAAAKPAAGSSAVVTSVAPAGLVVAPAPTGARIVRVGNQRWLAIDASPEVAYATVRDLWVSLGLSIEVDEPLVGVLETAWTDKKLNAESEEKKSALNTVLRLFRPSSGQRDRYRARIERTATNTAEVTITHRGQEEVWADSHQDTTKWASRPSDPELEADMLQRLSLRFAAVQPLRVAVAPAPAAPEPAAVAPAPVAAAAPVAAVAPAAAVATVASPKVHKVSTGGIVTLQAEDTPEHTWRRVGAALDHLGFTVETRNREKSQYAVRYLDPDYEVREKEKKSWWDKLVNADAKIPEQQFLIVVVARGALSEVQVQDMEGHPDAGATAAHILDQLLEQLL